MFSPYLSSLSRVNSVHVSQRTVNFMHNKPHPVNHLPEQATRTAKSNSFITIPTRRKPSAIHLMPIQRVHLFSLKIQSDTYMLPNLTISILRETYPLILFPIISHKLRVHCPFNTASQSITTMIIFSLRNQTRPQITLPSPPFANTEHLLQFRSP